MNICKFANKEAIVIRIVEEALDVNVQCYLNGEINYSVDNERKKELESEMGRTILKEINILIFKNFPNGMSYDQFLHLKQWLEQRLINSMQQSVFPSFGFQFDKIEIQDIRINPEDKKKIESYFKKKVQISKWTCSCGNINTSKFCPMCGKKKDESWICQCGKENKGNFCSECGKRRSCNE